MSNYVRNQKITLSILKDLNHEQKKDVIMWVACGMYSAGMIVKKVKDEFGIDIHKITIERLKNSPRYMPLIDKYRESFFEEIKKHAVFHTHGRVAMYKHILEKALDERIVAYNKFGVPIYKDDLGTAIQALKEIRNELNGNPSDTIININNNIVDIEQKSDDEIARELMDRLNKLN